MRLLLDLLGKFTHLMEESFELHPLELDYPCPLCPGFMRSLRSLTLHKRDSTLLHRWLRMGSKERMLHSVLGE